MDGNRGAVKTTCLETDCGAISEGVHPSCPVCDGRVMPQATFEALGWLQVACGVFLLGIGSVLTWAMAPTLLAPGEIIDGSTFDGTEGQAMLIFGVFGVLVMLGMAAISAGYSQVVHGRRNPGAIALVLMLAGALYLTALAIEAGWLG